jgi:hypothetical protein
MLCGFCEWPAWNQSFSVRVVADEVRVCHSVGLFEGMWMADDDSIVVGGLIALYYSRALSSGHVGCSLSGERSS